VCFLATAQGDSAAVLQNFYDAAAVRGLSASHLAVFPMPNVDDVAAHLLAQDVVWVFGGSVAGLLAMWRLHGYDDALRAAWQAGVVLTGVSAGSICWHVGGTTDSFGPTLRPITNGLGFVPFSNGVHYDSEEQRRPLFQSLIADGTLPAGYATDDGSGVLYRGTEFVEAVTEKDDKAAYYVEAGTADAAGTAVETRLDTRRL
jgi:peptidase E